MFNKFCGPNGKHRKRVRSNNDSESVSGYNYLNVISSFRLQGAVGIFFKVSNKLISTRPNDESERRGKEHDEGEEGTISVTQKIIFYQRDELDVRVYNLHQ